ncbi:MAG: sigma-70 family RNA polymerase sigma factor [Deltaproteobacteria bacterium]|nr:sigma-70 family RNA polymerase sigma factor [Deltaproteobacteria bacterium]MBW2419422.1 sigma-70 family RNA polymerase sigma factor [Deltaproteobacteria bacterium]
MLVSQDERVLIARAAAGHERSFELLYARYRTRVFAFVLSRLRDPDEADDVTQEVFFEVSRRLCDFEARSALLSWMLGIAHFKVLRRYRKRRSEKTAREALVLRSLSDPLAGQNAPDRAAEARRVLDRCEAVLQRELSPMQREIFHLRYRENETIPGVAAALGRSAVSVRVSLHRSRCTLVEHTVGLDAVLGA